MLKDNKQFLAGFLFGFSNYPGPRTFDECLEAAESILKTIQHDADIKSGVYGTLPDRATEAWSAADQEQADLEDDMGSWDLAWGGLDKRDETC